VVEAELKSQIAELAAAVRAAERVLAFTGAGIESPVNARSM
jgi:NAD-dependent SIR2 family protein deacetylase